MSAHRRGGLRVDWLPLFAVSTFLFGLIRDDTRGMLVGVFLLVLLNVPLMRPRRQSREESVDV